MYAEAIGTVMYDPEIKTSSAGTGYVKVTICDRTGCRGREDNEGSCFVDCICFGKTGDLVVSYLKRGSAVMMRGSIKVIGYVGKDGSCKGKITMSVDKMVFLPREKTYGSDTEPKTWKGNGSDSHSEPLELDGMTTEMIPF